MNSLRKISTIQKYHAQLYKLIDSVVIPEDCSTMHHTAF
jgi:hypothetical protein